MSAAVMSNYHSQLQLEYWMLAQMAHYPPPPQPDQQHYSPAYPTTTGAQQAVDSAAQSQTHYSDLSQSAYPKVETKSTTAADASPRLHSLAQEAQQQHSLNEQHHASQLSEQDHSSTGHAFQHQSQQPSGGDQAAQEQAQKANRLRKACDSCSIRKVKCDEAGPPCRACAALDIPCTFERPTRRRGPPNRHAEAIKRQRMEDGRAASTSGASAPPSPTHAAQALAALSANISSQPLTAESICPLDTLDLLIDDFFTYIHPLTPFPHEPSFREAWRHREDLSNKSFLALLASMIGALVASFPRKPRLHLKAQRKEHLFPSHMSLIQRCQMVCSLARGPGYLENENLSVYDAATSYFLALMGTYTFRWRQGRLYFGECLTIIRTLGLHKASGLEFTGSGGLPSVNGRLNGQDDSEHQPDKITLEVGRRIFYTMFVTVKTIQQLGASFGELQIPPPTNSDPYPPLPTEVDDIYIYPTHYDSQPHGIVPKIAGFNANVRVYSSYQPLATMELAWGMDAVVDFDRQRAVMHESLRRCKASIMDLPPELIVYSNIGPFRPHPQSNGSQPHGSFPPMYGRDGPAPLLSPTSRHLEYQQQSPSQRRRMQYEIQKANIYASSLASRSYIVEKYWNLIEANSRLRSQQSPGSDSNSPSIGVTAAGLDRFMAQQQQQTSGYDAAEHEFREERESIVKDLLTVLSSIDQENMEPNADSFTMKIRSIASTLLELPDQRKGHLAIQAQEYLAAFLNILMKLERTSPSNSDPGTAEDEAAELRHWADLREYQLKFAQQGGLLGFS
nr:hypothetical protein B0A51_09001 [Rachicladosporium sp. CCFEE 5018]